MGFYLKKYVKMLVMLGLIVFSIGIFVSSLAGSYMVGEPSHSIEKIYGPLADINGWINISFDEKSANSVFSSFFDNSPGNSTSLQELLDKNPAYKDSCTCIPLDCGKDYSATNGETSKTFILDSGDSEILGLKISSSQPIGSISSFSMGINSNSTSSSVPQLVIDVLDNNETDWRAYKPYEQYQTEDYGCFEEDDSEELAQITTTEYCQEISMPIFPQVKIGAKVQEITGGNVNFTISIRDKITGDRKSCIQNISSSGKISCTISNLKTTQPRDFFVCIKTTSSADIDKYGVRHEENNVCGFTDFFYNAYTYDFEIFAQASYYDDVGSFILNDTEMDNSGSDLVIEDEIFNYIIAKYERDCSNECIIPIKFASGADNQEIVVSDISLSYMAGISSSTTTIYELTEDFAKISSDYQRLFLDKAGFSVPSNLDNYSLSLKLDDEEIFSEDIEVKDVPIIKSLTPVETATTFPTEFVVEVVSPIDIEVVDYSWDFGDGSTETTSINKGIHIYSVIGLYDLQVTVTDTRGFSSSKTFEINVSSPKDLINTTLNKMDINLRNLRIDIQNQDTFYQTSLNSVLRIENISSELERLEQQFSVATNHTEYIAIVGDLLALKKRLPENIFKTKQANSFSFFPEKSFIDMDIVQSIGGGNYDSKKIENYRDAVFTWQQENVDLIMDFNEFSGEYDSVVDSLVNIFEIRLTEKKDIIYDYYLIIPKLQGIVFDRNVEEKGDFIYVNLKDVSRVSFYTTEDVEFSNLPAFIAPPINKLVVSDTSSPSEEPERRNMIVLILSLVSLVIIGIIVYVIIYHWYKRRYEKYLFKNRNDLYNIVTYVDSSKKKGLDNRKIIRSLRKSGWGSEQRKYVMKKYKGKRTGMARIPIRLAKKIKKDNPHKGWKNVSRK